MFGGKHKLTIKKSIRRRIMGYHCTKCLPWERMDTRLHLRYLLQHLACQCRKESIYGCKVVVSAASSDGDRGTLVGSKRHHPDVREVSMSEVIPIRSHGCAISGERDTTFFCFFSGVRYRAALCNRALIWSIC